MSSSSLRTAALRGGEGATALALPLPFPFRGPRSDVTGCDVPEGRMRSEGSVPRGETHGVPRRGGIVLISWRCYSKKESFVDKPIIKLGAGN
jgi:hypothetical protein